MKPVLYYLAQVICISAILYGYYHFALRNKKFHRYNRFYLLATIMISILIPFINIPVYLTKTETDSSFLLQTLTVISSPGAEEISAPVLTATSHTSWFSVRNILYVLYMIVAALVFIRIIFSLLRIRNIIKKNTIEQLDSIRFVNTEEPGTPFSFFRWLFWNKKIELRSEKGEQIFRHELFHIEQKHTWDVIFMELLTVIFWINPFFHLIKKEIKAIHEFLADRFAINENKKWEYAELLLMQAFHTNQHLVNPFFHNQIKRRIAMITTSQKPSYRYLRKIMVLPLAAVAAALFAFSYKSKKEIEKPNGLEKPITVIIDAGHGGTDAGARSLDGILEKDIVLAIAQRIKSLNEDKNIQIVLTRDADVSPLLKDRTEFANNNNPDLFFSIHVNTSSNANDDKGNSQTGFEVYIPKKNKTFYSENKILGSILLNYFSQVYPVNNSIKQAETSIWVLENVNCPSALIECGYLNNARDLDFIKDPVNQDKIAQSILQTIDQFIMQKKSDDWEERKSVFSGAGSNNISNSLRYIEFWNGKNKISAYVNSANFKSGSANSNTEIKQALILLDNEKMTAVSLYGKTIEAKTVVIYDPTNEEAVKIWGQEARNGVVQFNDVRSIKVEITQKANPDTTKPVNVDNKIFDKVEVEATFSGGEEKWKQYLSANLNSSVGSQNRAPDGAYTVVVQFIVDKEGNISNIRPLTKHGYGMEDEAIKLIKEGPKWKPAIQNGRIVKSYKKILVTFVVGKGEKNFPGNTKNTTNKMNEEVN